MQLSNIIANIGTGSHTATPNLGSAAGNQIAALPSMLIGYAAGVLKTLGS